jgi:hypothetical protein
MHLTQASITFIKWQRPSPTWMIRPNIEVIGLPSSWYSDNEFDDMQVRPANEAQALDDNFWQSDDSDQTATICFTCKRTEQIIPKQAVP